MKRKLYHRILEIVAPGVCQERRELRIALARSRLASDRLTRTLNHDPGALAVAVAKKVNPWQPT